MPLRELSPDDVQLIRDMYARRYGIGTLAAKFRVTKERVKKIVESVEREPGQRRARKSELWERQAARSLRAEGMTIREIGRTLQRSDVTVSHWLQPDAEEKRAQYESRLEELTEKRRQAFELFDLGHYSNSRICRKVGVAEGTLYKWLAQRAAEA